MRLTCKNFKTFENRDFILPDTGLVLLNGPSGVGKTTFMKAIQFALFGSIKKPYTYNKKSLSVELNLKDLHIQRNKGPELLTVNKYEDDVAQGLIHKTIGMTEEEFLASSYIQQKMANSLLTLSPKDQLRFIESLAFAGNSPDEFKNKINKYLNEKKKEIDRLSGKLEVLIDQQNAIGNELLFLEEPNKPEEVLVSKDIEEQIAKLKEDYQKASDSLKEWQDLLENEGYEQRLTLTQQIMMYEQTKVATERQLEKFLSEEAPDLEYLNNRLKNLEDQKHTRDLIKEYESGLEEFNKWDEQKKLFEEEKQATLDSYRGFIEQNVSVLDDIDDINSCIEWLEKLGYLKEKAQGFFSEFNVDKKGVELEEAVGGILKQKIATGEQKVHSLIQERMLLPSEIDILQARLQNKMDCPECGTPLKYENGTLSHSKGFDPKQTALELEQKKARELELQTLIPKIDSEVKLLKEKEKTLNEIIETRVSLVQDKPNNIFSKDIDACKKELERLEAIAKKIHSVNVEGEVLASKTFPQDYQLSLLKEKIDRNREFVNSDYHDFEDNLEQKIEEVKTKISNADSAEKLIVDAKNQILHLEGQINTAKASLEKISLPERDFVVSRIKEHEKIKNNAYNRLNELRDELNAYNAYKSALAVYESQMTKISETQKRRDDNFKSIESLNTEIKSLEEKYAHGSYIKSISDKAQMAAVTNIINSINTSAKDFLDILFPENPMNVQICPFKENKDGSVRFKLSTVVSYRGQEGVDFKEDVSGGENDRIVLAYQLALNSLYNSPLIMLDEPFTGLNPELVELAVESLRLISQDRLVIVVSHGIEKGMFDEVIDFD